MGMLSRDVLHPWNLAADWDVILPVSCGAKPCVFDLVVNTFLVSCFSSVFLCKTCWFVTFPSFNSVNKNSFVFQKKKIT